jgi:4'-phosphopantetheinyl transferase
MKSRPLVVPPWTAAGRLPMPEDGLLVFSLTTPYDTNRDVARQLVRTALRETLAPLLGCTPAAVPLISVPGQAIRLALQEGKIGLSVSHEAGLSLVAIHLHGAVGVDLLRVAEIPLAGEEVLRLARDYLGAGVASRLSSLTEEARWQAFAEAWAGLEAGLKCQGEGLVECSPERQALLANCRIRELALPAGLLGAVAVRIGP